MDWDYQRLIDAVDDRIVNRPERVILAFLVVSVVFAGGLGSISTDAGTQQFAESTDAQAAFDEVQENFEDPFAVSQGSTQLIQRSQNVLSKRSLRNMLLAQERAANIPETRVAGTPSVPSAVAPAANSVPVIPASASASVWTSLSWSFSRFSDVRCTVTSWVSPAAASAVGSARPIPYARASTCLDRASTTTGQSTSGTSESHARIDGGASAS